MKWCLITTIGKNPGDEFIRIGVRNLIQSIDTDAEFILVDKETPNIHQKHQFDKCILCGMPVFWSYKGNNFWNVPWWKPIREYYSQKKENFMIIGAGSFQNWANPTFGIDNPNYVKYANEIINKSWKIILRDNIPNQILNSNIPVLPCPAIFSTKHHSKTNELKLCNIMPDAGHYKVFDPNQASAWLRVRREIHMILKKHNFTFIAHNNNEFKHARENGWQQIIKYSGDPETLLASYKNCTKYFGNRVHGAIVSRGVNADVLSCGFDSRQEAVKLVGATSLLPGQISLPEIEKWCNKPLNQPFFDFQEEFNIQKDILNEFKNA